MKFVLLEDQIDYNANPYNKNEKDCVIRALSLAYDLQYNSVKSELHSIAKNNKDIFNSINTINNFINKHGFKKYYNNESDGSFIDDVEDFAKKNKHGVYIVYCSDRTKQDTSHSFHLVTIVEGNIYDTWDSSNYYVLGAWYISNYNRTIKKINN